MLTPSAATRMRDVHDALAETINPPNPTIVLLVVLLATLGGAAGYTFAPPRDMLACALAVVGGSLAGVLLAAVSMVAGTLTARRDL